MARQARSPEPRPVSDAPAWPAGWGLTGPQRSCSGCRLLGSSYFPERLINFLVKYRACLGGRQRPRPAAGSALRHHPQHRLAIRFQLLRPQPRYLAQFRQRHRSARGDLAQGGVVQDDVGGHALLVGGFAAPGAQGQEQGIFVVVNAGAGTRGEARFLARRPRFDGAQHDGFLALEHRLGCLGELERAVGAVVHLQQPAHHELAQHGAPDLVALAGAAAEHGELSVAEAVDLFRGLAEQHVDDVAGAEARAGAVDGGEQLLRGLGAVPQRGRIEADVAVAAGLAGFAEVAQQRNAAAAGRLAQADQGVELGVADALVRVLGLALVDEAALGDDILQAPRHPRLGRLAVAPGAAGFLVVALDRARQVEVRDEAHVGLVDAHTERERGDHDDAVLAQEFFLMAAARVVVHAAVVRQRGEAGLRQAGGGFLDLLARAAIDDAGLAFVFGKEIEQLAARVGFLGNAITDVGAIEAGDEDARGAQIKALQDFGARLRR